MEVTATNFKARCLALLDEVAESGSEFVITKRGCPVAKVTPVDADSSLRGSVEYLVDDEDLIAPLDLEWKAAG